MTKTASSAISLFSSLVNKIASKQRYIKVDTQAIDYTLPCEHVLVEAATRKPFHPPFFTLVPYVNHVPSDYVYQITPDGMYLVWLVFRYTEMPENIFLSEIFGTRENAMLILEMNGVEIKEGLPPYFRYTGIKPVKGWMLNGYKPPETFYSV